MSETRFRHILNFAVVLLLLLSLALPVLAADEAEIRVTVPSEHTVTVTCGSGGKVTVGQTEYTGTNNFPVQRHSDFLLTASPESGYELVSITGESVCQMTFDGNGATLEKVSKDTLVTVLFRPVERADDPVHILVPVTSQNNSIAAQAVISGDEASISLDETEFNEFLESDADLGDVTVDISHLGVNISTVAIPAPTVRAIAEQAQEDGEKQSGMSILMPNSTVTFDSGALVAISEQAGDEALVLHVEEIDTEELNPEQKKAIQELSDSQIVVTVTLKSGDEIISDFDGGSIDIELPYEPQENENTETITVWYVSEDGSMEQIPCRYNNGFVTFTVFHFSEYLIVPGIIPAGSHCFICGLIGQDIDPWCWLIPMIVVITALAVAAVIFLKKSKKKQA